MTFLIYDLLWKVMKDLLEEFNSGENHGITLRCVQFANRWHEIFWTSKEEKTWLKYQMKMAPLLSILLLFNNLIISMHLQEAEVWGFTLKQIELDIHSSIYCCCKLPQKLNTFYSSNMNHTNICTMSCIIDLLFQFQESATVQ